MNERLSRADAADELRGQAASCRRLASKTRTAEGSSALEAVADHFEADARRVDFSSDALSPGGQTEGDSMHYPNIIERAFQLARSSSTIEEIRKALRREGYSQVDAHLAGSKIRSDLQKVLSR
jgi:hypothetical protein